MTGRNNRGGPSRQTSQDDDTRSQPLQYPPSSLPKLKGSGQDNNWLTWKSLILSFLQSIALDVYLSAPEVDYDEETDSVEKRLDGHVKTCLMLTSEESIHRALYGKKRAYQMWTELCTQFENQGVQSRCTLLYKFLETKRYNFNSLKEYVLSIRGTFEQLPPSCLSSEVAAAIVLSNLREEDGLIRRFAEESCTTTNDNNEKVLNFQLVTQKLLQEAQTEEAEAARESSKGTAMVAFQGFQGQGQSRGSNFRGRWQPRRGGFRGRGRGGSNSRGGFNNSQFKSGVQSFPRCRHCERTNHAEKDCYWSDPEKRKQLKAAKAGEKRKNTEGPARWELRSSKDQKPEGPGVAKTAKRGALESLIENRSLGLSI